MIELSRDIQKMLKQQDASGQHKLPAFDIYAMHAFCSGEDRKGELAQVGQRILEKILKEERVKELFHDIWVHRLFSATHGNNPAIAAACKDLVTICCRRVGTLKSLMKESSTREDSKAVHSLLLTLPSMWKFADKKQTEKLLELATSSFSHIENGLEQAQTEEGKESWLLVAAGILGGCSGVARENMYDRSTRSVVRKLINLSVEDEVSFVSIIAAAVDDEMFFVVRGMFLAYFFPRTKDNSSLNFQGHEFSFFAKVWLENEKDPLGSVISNLDQIIDLEIAQIGSTKRLYKEYGIVNFSRYSTDLLLNQLSDKRSDVATLNLVVIAHSDWTGAFSNWWNEFDVWRETAGDNHKFVFVEVSTIEEIAVFAKEVSEKFKTSLNSIHLFAHGNRTSQDLGIEPNQSIPVRYISSTNPSWKVIAECCNQDVHLILHGCKSGEDFTDAFKLLLGNKATVSGLRVDGSFYGVSPIVSETDLQWSLIPPSSGGSKSKKPKRA